MSSSSSPSSTFSNQITWGLCGILTVVVVTVSAFGFWAVNRVDDRARDRHVRFVTGLLQEELRELTNQQRSAASWDEAVIHIRSNDLPWLATNIGQWMYGYFGHDQSFLLDTQDRPFYAMIDGRTVAPEAFEAERDSIEPMIEQLRGLMAAASTPGEDSTPAVRGLVVAGYVDVGDKVALVSVVPVTPGADAPEPGVQPLTQLPGTENVHVAVLYADQEFADDIADHFELEGARISSTPEDTFWRSSVPMVDQAGNALNYFSWTRYRPGFTIVSEMGPFLLLAGFAALGSLLFLIRRLRRASVQLQASEAHAHFLAQHDALTGLPNRALFEWRLGEALALLGRERHSLAVLYIDLDGFKAINDTLGHGAGDELVRQVGGRLAWLADNGGLIARIGGDEFAMLIFDPGTKAAVEARCETLRQTIGKPYELLGNEAKISASIGVTWIDKAEDADTVLRQADTALYRAKELGRNRYVVFHSAMEDEVKEKRDLERELRIALDTRTQLKLVYQPLFSGLSGNVTGAEALARWDHPTRGPLSPEIFIRVAEERGLIQQLGKWALEEACLFAVSVNLPKIAVNVSPTQLRDKGFVDWVLALLKDVGLDPHKLELELTEKVMIDPDGLTRATLQELRRAGIRIALDDFGTGRSVFQYVRDYGVDKLKVDRSFVNRLGMDDGANALVHSVIELAKTMDLRVTAEGVETEEQQAMLQAMGCDELQGYLLSRPISSEQLREMLDAKAEERRVG